MSTNYVIVMNKYVSMTLSCVKYACKVHPSNFKRNIKKRNSKGHKMNIIFLGPILTNSYHENGKSYVKYVGERPKDISRRNIKKQNHQN